MSDMESVPSLHEVLLLCTSPDKFYISPASSSEVLVIDRVSEAISLEVNHGQIPVCDERKEIYGVLGSVRLLTGLYLVVVTGRVKVGTINKQDIWRMAGHQLISYSRSSSHLTEKQLRLERELKCMMETVLSIPHYYFSYNYDLTHSAQRLHNTSPDFLQTPLYSRADQKFVWNHHLIEDFTSKNSSLSQYSLPIILGFVSINSCFLNGRMFTYALVSRRSRYRAGTRLFTRGIDDQGNVANFVETEQIVETTCDLSSFIQTRGSIPLYWSQWPNLALKPKPRLNENENHQPAFSKHFEAQVAEYGKQVIVNLINQDGAEGLLEKSFKDMVELVNNPNVRYEAFDFHKECAKMRYDRLKILSDRLSHDQESLGVFLQINDSSTVSLQEGVFRTNCIDCLDRTNVVQSMLARNSLTYVLQRLSILRRGERVESAGGLEALFKATWADHADAISTQYSGTGALKTDFTRTGKRSTAGVMQDMYNSLLRYYKNNFRHGHMQDSLDLFLGNYKVHPDEGASHPSPLDAHKGWKYLIFPLILLVAIAMFFANLTSPAEYNTGTLLCLMFWGSMVGFSLFTIFYYGTEFVDSPRLCPLVIPGPTTVFA